MASQEPVNTQDLTQVEQCTQGAMDPRRMGRNNSGLSEADISDVMCILHPCSPAAFKIVASTAERAPHNVLQNTGYDDFDDGLTQSILEEQETFILNTEGSHQAMDLALRLTTEVVNPTLGFVFGRNQKLCDIVLACDTYKRVSNMHFSIFMNRSGVLMLQDMSTNGTMVDDVVLKGKHPHQPQTRMLSPGSIIQILSPKTDEIVKFIVRIPPRDGHFGEYEAKFDAYMQRMEHAHALKAKQDDMIVKKLVAAETKTQSASSYKAPMVSNHFGMYWNGGDKYNVVGHIGKGAFATVYQLATKSEGQLFAAKELEKRRFMKNGVLDRKLDNEMQIMKEISHPNIVKYVDYQDHTSYLYIIMEFVPFGDLQQYLGRHSSLPESVGVQMAAQVLDALAYLHAKRITHRDIKPDNILLANAHPVCFDVKLSDFGLSKVVKDNDTFLKTFCGTLLYCAPEVFPHYDAHVAGRGQKRTRKGPAQPPTKFHMYSQSVDIWSFGAVLWYSLCMKPPFEGVADNTGRGMFEKIMMTPLEPTDLVKQGVSEDAIEMLASMLNTDPASRPSPQECLKHKWFHGKVPQTGEVTQGEDGKDSQEGAMGMWPIQEEQEGEFGEDALSQLSLGDQGGSHGSQDSHYDEASIHSGSLNFLDPRQSKRFKSDAHAYRDQGEMIDSSPELMHQSIRIAYPPSASRPQRQSTQPKLFGEISLSALNDPAILGARANSAVGNSLDGASPESQGHDSTDSALQAQHAALRGAMASPSLLGAESLMRDVHMHSPNGSTESPSAEANEPTTPRTPPAVTGSPNGTPNAQDDVTPKQPQPPAFSRQITLPVGPSFYFDPHDPSTHTLEYASKKSGYDYVRNPSYLGIPETSLPSTTTGSATDHEHDEHGGDTDAEPDMPALMRAVSEFVKPPPRLGRLVSTPGSFEQITLNLTDRVSKWGRAPSNTHVYQDHNNIKVPKLAIIAVFHAKGIDKVAERGEDWTKLPDLHCVITTQSSRGLCINGIELKKGEPGKMRYGRLHTGDEITVWRDSSDGSPGLKFTCEFFHGEAKDRRPEGGPRFTVETEEPESAPRRSKGKGRARERDSGLAAEKVAAA